MAALARAIFSWSLATTCSFSVRSNCLTAFPARRLSAASGLLWASVRPDGRCQNPLAKQGTLRFATSRLGGSGGFARLAASAPAPLRTRSGRGPAVLDQESPGGPVPPVL